MTIPNNNWPRISLVIVSYNQAQYLEEAIESILSQNYPNLELIVADGGSKDGSVDIIKRYESSLTRWFSERDRGQSHALNKAFKGVTGEICNWLCSDDLLVPGSLQHVAELFARDAQLDVVTGAGRFQHDQHPAKSSTSMATPDLLDSLPARNLLLQPSCFFRRRLWGDGDLLREDLHYTMDWELWCRFVKQGAKWGFTDHILGVYRVTGENKAFVGGNKMRAEMEVIYKEYCGEIVPLTLWFRTFWLPLVQYSRRRQQKFDGRVANRVARVFMSAIGLLYSRPRCDGLRHQYRAYLEQEEALNRTPASRGNTPAVPAPGKS